MWIFLHFVDEIPGVKVPSIVKRKPVFYFSDGIKLGFVVGSVYLDVFFLVFAVKVNGRGFLLFPELLVFCFQRLDDDFGVLLLILHLADGLL